MPGTGSAEPVARVRPPRLSPQRLSRSEVKGFEDAFDGAKSTSCSRIGSAASVASSSRMSEKEAAGLITDLTRLKEITHDVRIPRPELPHRKAIADYEEEQYQDDFGITDWEFPTELAEKDYDHVEHWNEQLRHEDGELDDEDLSDLQELEDVFGDDAASVSSLGSNPDDDAENYDTDLDEDHNVPDRQDMDNSGKNRYLRTCEEMGIQPATYYIKHMSDTELVMKFHGLGPQGMRAMSDSLEINTILEKIDLEGNYILGEGAGYLTRVLKDNVYVTELVLTDNNIGNDGAKRICELLSENKTIIHLNLSGNELEDAAAEYFYEMLSRNSAIKTLGLRHNSFEEKGAEWFSLALNENVTLESLDISWNKFQSKGCVMIADALKENVGLKYCDMSMNGFGLEGAKAMEEALKENKYLIRLNMSYCRIPLEGTPYIAAGLQTNDTLNELLIGYNPISGEGGLAILVGVERNQASAMTRLDFGNLMVRKEFDEIMKRLGEERNLKVIIGGVLSDVCRSKKPGNDPLARLMNDPLNKLKAFVEQAGYRMIDLLKTFDKDQSFTISLDELKEGVRRCGLDMTDPEVAELMKRLDKDGNGEIDFAELLEGDSENRKDRREVKKLMEEKEKQDAERQKLASGADAKSYLQILEGKS